MCTRICVARRHDVAVGHHVAVGRDDEARAGAARAAPCAADLEADDRGAGALDDVDHGARVRVEQIGIVVGGPAIGHSARHARLPSVTASVVLHAAAERSELDRPRPAGRRAPPQLSGPVIGVAGELDEDVADQQAGDRAPGRRPRCCATSAPRARELASAAGYAPTPR